MPKPTRNTSQTVDPGGLSVKEIARREGCSELEIQRLLKSALQKLRTRAKSDNFPEVDAARNHFITRDL